MKKLLTLFLIFCAAALSAENKAMPPLAIPTARSTSMGGFHTAYTDNVFALLVNPAAIMRVEQRSFVALSPTLYNPQSTFSLISPISALAGGDTKALGDAMDILSKKKGKIPLGAELREFPLSFAWVADGFGFGLWNRTFVNFDIIGTDVKIELFEDVILPVGFAFRILDIDHHAVDAGITVKPFVRALAATTEPVGILKFSDNDFKLEDHLTTPVIVGGGFDIGFLYRWDTGLSAGLTFSDIVTRGGVVTTITGTDNNTYYVPFSMNLGLAYDFKLGQFWKTAPKFFANTGFTVTFDWHDMVNAFQQKNYLNRNAALDVSLGFQITMLDMIMVRLGMNELLPAIGIGFDLGPVEIDLSYYGKEFGLEPGQLSAAAVDLTIALRPGAKKRDWPWTRGSLVGLISSIKK